MKKSILFLGLMLSMGILLAACTKNDTTPQPLDSFEGGKLYKSPSGSFYIAELHGTFHQMGRQYGLLLKQQIGEFYQESVVDFLIGEQEITYDELVVAGRLYYNDFSQMFRDYLDGMAETNGLTPDRLSCIRCQHRLYRRALLPDLHQQQRHLPGVAERGEL